MMTCHVDILSSKEPDSYHQLYPGVGDLPVYRIRLDTNSFIIVGQRLPSICVLDY